MSDETQKKVAISSDLVFRLLPYVLLLATYLIGWGKRDSSLDGVLESMHEQHTAINAIGDRMTTLSDRISKIEGLQESLRRDLDQDRAYRDSRR